MAAIVIHVRGISSDASATFTYIWAISQRPSATTSAHLQINRRIYAGETFRAFGSLGELACIEHLLGHDEVAFEYLTDRLADTRETLQNAFGYASEEQKLRYTNLYPPIHDLFLNFVADQKSDEVITSAYEMVLSGKALVIEAIAEERAVAVCSIEPAIADVVSQHSNTCGEIASLVLSGGRKPELYVARLQELYQSKEQLETELSGLCAEFSERRLLDDMSVSDVAAKLPRNATLWEFLRYRHFDFRKPPSEGRWGAPRYLVFTLDNRGQVSLVDLGEAEAH